MEEVCLDPSQHVTRAKGSEANGLPTGGAQNIGSSKNKSSSKAGQGDSKSAKSGGFKGIRGIM